MNKFLKLAFDLLVSVMGDKMIGHVITYDETLDKIGTTGPFIQKLTRPKKKITDPTCKQCKELLIFQQSKNHTLDSNFSLPSVDLRTQVKLWVPEKP